MVTLAIVLGIVALIFLVVSIRSNDPSWIIGSMMLIILWGIIIFIGFNI